MKKRKIYEISIIDKTYSKTISDETKFYTSDTALELGFELKETEYNFESAEIVLLNVDDRSLVTRPVVKVLDSFAYELEDDIIAHYGEWRGQLRFEQAGETYVSSPVKFRIENDLSNERPPQLSDVQSWVSLKRYADSLIEELKQAVLGIEGIEDTFNANEIARQTTFETNESERNETFESNENARQAQEMEREGAETTRQTTFTTNEANRTETFNSNEATRQENENARIEAEKQRQETLQRFETFEDGHFLSPNSITPDKISPDNADYIDIYDKTTNTDGFFVNISGGGNLIANANFSASDFYPIEKDRTYEFFNADGNGVPLYPALALYDTSKVYIDSYISSGLANDTTTRFIAPNDGFVRFSIRKSNVDIAFFREVVENAFKKLNWLSVDETNLTTELLEKVNSISSTPTPVVASAEYSHSLAKPFIFSGKSSVWFGDSITYGMSSPDASNPSLHYTANGYVKIFSDSVGMTNVNRAISGTTFADTLDTNSILNRVLAYTTPKDFVFVAGGTNDHSLNKPLGALGDTTGETVYGALHVICQHFKTNYATSQVIFITPLEKTRDYPNQVAPLDSYRKAVYEMAVINGYSVVDGRKVGFPSDKGAFADLLISDGVHPSELGHEHYAKTLQGILN